MIDKIVHFLGGIIINFYGLPCFNLQNRWSVTIPLLVSTVAGILIEFLQTMLNVGKWDILDIYATMFGGLVFSVWMVKDRCVS